MTSSNVQVFVRVRPFVDRERGHPQSIVRLQGSVVVLLDPADLQPREQFAFDRCFGSAEDGPDPRMGQAEVYQALGPPMLDNILAGYNACLFAYGQTGSGKTYTMMGDVESEQGRGVVPRLCEALFEQMRKLQHADPAVSFKLEASYMEIYTEQVRDLLTDLSPGLDDADRVLRVRQHPVSGPFVEGLSSFVVPDFTTVRSLLLKGDKARTTACTRMNDRSSRSHAIFTMSLAQLRLVGPSDTRTRSSKIHLVDLAGSERVALSGVEGIHFKEATSINLSLTTLGRVIDVLLENAKRKDKRLVPPYRDSLLTWILSESIGGNSRTCMVAAVSPSRLNYEETLGTLRYASRAREVVNVAVVNEDSTGAVVQQLRAQVETLARTADVLREREAGYVKRLRDLEGSAGPAEGSVEQALQQRLREMKARFEEERQVWRAEKATFETRLEEKEEQLATLRAAGPTTPQRRSPPEAQGGSQGDFRAEVAALHRQLVAATKQLQQLAEEKARLQATVEQLTAERPREVEGGGRAAEADGRPSPARDALAQLARCQQELRAAQERLAEGEGVRRLCEDLKRDNVQLADKLRTAQRLMADGEVGAKQTTTQLSRVEEECQELKEKVATLRGAVTSQTTLIGELQAENAGLQERVSSLTRAQRREEGERQRAQEACQAQDSLLVQERTKWEEERSKLQAQLRQLQLERVASQGDQRKATHEGDRWRAEAERLQGLVQDLQSAQAQLETDHRTATAQLAALQRQAVDVEVRRAEAEAQAAEEKARSVAKAEQLERQRRALTEEAAELRRQLQERERATGQQLRMEDKYERAQNESQRQYVERERLLLQSSKLAAQLEEARDAQGKLAIEKDMLQKQLNVYRERVSRGDDKVSQLEEVVAQLRAQGSRTDSLQQERQALQRAVDDLSAAKEQWAAERAQLSRGTAEHEAEVQSLQERVAEMEGDGRRQRLEREQLQRQLEQTKRDAAEVAAEQQRGAGEREALRREVADLRRARYQLEAERSDLQDRLGAMQREAEAADAQRKALAADLSQETGEGKVLHGEVRTLRQEKEDLQIKLAEERSLVVALQRAARQAEAGRQATDVEAQALAAVGQEADAKREAELRKAQAEVTVQQKRTEGLLLERRELQAAMDDLADTLQTERQQRAKLEEALQAAHSAASTTSGLTQQVEELQARLATSEAAAREGEVRAAALQGERAALKEAVERLRRAQAQKEEKLEALRRENAELARSAEQQRQAQQRDNDARETGRLAAEEETRAQLESLRRERDAAAEASTKTSRRLQETMDQLQQMQKDHDRHARRLAAEREAALGERDTAEQRWAAQLEVEQRRRENERADWERQREALTGQVLRLERAAEKACHEAAVPATAAALAAGAAVTGDVRQRLAKAEAEAARRGEECRRQQQTAEMERKVLEGQLAVLQDELRLAEGQALQAAEQLHQQSAAFAEAGRLREAELLTQCEARVAEAERAAARRGQQLQTELAQAAAHVQTLTASVRQLEEQHEARHLKWVEDDRLLKELRQQQVEWEFVQHELEHQQEQLVAERDELQRRLQASQAEAEGGEEKARREAERLRAEMRQRTEAEKARAAEQAEKLQRAKALAELQSRRMMHGLLDKAMENSEALLTLGGLEELLRVVVEEVEEKAASLTDSDDDDAALPISPPIVCHTEEYSSSEGEGEEAAATPRRFRPVPSPTRMGSRPTTPPPPQRSRSPMDGRLPTGFSLGATPRRWRSGSDEELD